MLVGVVYLISESTENCIERRVADSETLAVKIADRLVKNFQGLEFSRLHSPGVP